MFVLKRNSNLLVIIYIIRMDVVYVASSPCLPEYIMHIRVYVCDTNTKYNEQSLIILCKYCDLEFPRACGAWKRYQCMWLGNIYIYKYVYVYAV